MPAPVRRLASAALMTCTLALLSARLASAADNGAALTPFRGWSSWNLWHRNISSALYTETADALVALGLAGLGYELVATDGGWWRGVDTGTIVRNASGFVLVDEAKFPAGLAPVIAHLHARGLSWGQYTDAGTHACNGDAPMSEGYEAQDAALFLSLGIDWLKLDACSVREAPRAVIARWAALLNASARPVTFANCRNGCLTQAGTPPASGWAPWCAELANSWRVSSDIQATWASMLHNLDAMRGYGAEARPGQWRDPDQLECGIGEFAWSAANASAALALNRVHFGLWAITSSPLMLGLDVRPAAAPAPALLAMFAAPRALRINAEYAGGGGDYLSAGAVAGTEVWSKPLLPAGRAAAVALFNRNASAPARISIALAEVPGLPPGATDCDAEDVWTGARSSASGGVFVVEGVAPRDMVFVIFANCSAAAPPQARALRIVGNVTARPSTAQLAWMAYEVGVMITFNLQSLCVSPSARNASKQRCQVDSLALPTLEALRAYDPPSLDAGAWLDIAATFGAKYAVLVADHMSGFTLWPTEAHNISIAATAWRGGRGDVVADFFAAAARTGIAPGLFYSTHYNWVLGMNEYRVGWPRLYGGAPLTQEEYEDLALQQLAELAVYKPVELWFDGGVNLSATPRVGAAVRSLFPSAMCHSCAGFSEAPGAGPGRGRSVRWMGNEQGAMPLPSWGANDALVFSPGGVPTGDIFSPPSCDTVLTNHQWFYQQGEDAFLRSTCDLANVYLTSVGRASNLILNMAPPPSGAVLPAEVAAYAAMGAAIRCVLAQTLANWSGLVLDGATGAVAVAAAVACPAPAGCNFSVVVQEDMAAGGQRIGEWALEACVVAAAAAASGGDAACTRGAWVSVLPASTPQAATTGVGHKRILAASTAPGFDIAALRFTALTAYAWVGDASSPPLALASLAMVDRAAAAACVPAGCKLVAY